LLWTVVIIFAKALAVLAFAGTGAIFKNPFHSSLPRWNLKLQILFNLPSLNYMLF